MPPASGVRVRRYSASPTHGSRGSLFRPSQLEAPAGLAEQLALPEAEGLRGTESVRQDPVAAPFVIHHPIAHLKAKKPSVLSSVLFGEPSQRGRVGHRCGLALDDHVETSQDVATRGDDAL